MYARSHSSLPSVEARPESRGLQIIGVARTYAANQEIFAERDGADFVFKVVSGAVRTVRLLADGRRQIMAFHLPGDVFGYELGATRRCAAEAVNDAVVVAARRSTLTDPEALCRHALAELARSEELVLSLGRRTAAERVADFLLEMADREGAAELVELPMSRQDIADHLGLTIETVSRTLTQLQTKGLVEVQGCRKVRLIRAALARLVA